MADVNTVISLLENQLQQIDDLLQEGELTKSEKFNEWKNTTDTILLRLFGKEEKEYKDVAYLNYWPYSSMTEEGDPERLEAYERDLKRAKASLKSTITTLNLLGMPLEKPIVHKSGNTITVTPVFNNSNSQQQSQSQEVNLTQAIKEAIELVDNNYGSEKAEEAKALLGDLEKEPKKWENTRKVVKFFADLGRDAFIAAVPVITSTVLKG